MEIPIFTSKLLNFNSETEKINDPGSRKVQSRSYRWKIYGFYRFVENQSPESCNFYRCLGIMAI